MSIMASFVGTEIEGVRSSPLESDYYSHAFIARKFQDFDLELFASKWFDYRHMTPFQATCAYIDVYGDVYREIYAREMDRSRAEFIRPITVDSVRQGLRDNDTAAKTIFTGCWRGRQVADAIGMPYRDYIEQAFTFRMRKWQRPYLPRPMHLYHEFDVEKIIEKWGQIQSSRLCVSDHPAYILQNFCGTQAQNDYHEWLFAQANMRSNVPYILARFVKEDRLPLSKVLARLDELGCERVRYYLEQDD